MGEKLDDSWNSAVKQRGEESMSHKWISTNGSFIFYNYNIQVILSRGSVGPTRSTASPSRVKANQTIFCLFVYMQDYWIFFFSSAFLFLFSERTGAAKKTPNGKVTGGVMSDNDFTMPHFTPLVCQRILVLMSRLYF